MSLLSGGLLYNQSKLRGRLLGGLSSKEMNMSFKEAVKNAMKGGKLDKKAAAAAVAKASRNASPAAKRRNPKLKKVK